ncbi:MULTISPECIES: lacticin 481 family lantibiotic [Leuconostoc]|uniref:lacticin 481 family lantibiotic n=1 Tax=Leuconostoc TaxID=1243 RepID=UPI000744D23F|nr:MULTISPECIES: lacticin 481 family lantibiotic [Leuconostoc]MBR2276920.1 type A2 lantipeptide [Leuconostoc sp.]MBZ5952544.1 type A2 lantipeptide [Leuconostoc gasicomitatum]MBZ5955417.1 type A2 lantipeptide [Leuconostoc gasicomitatum]MBZ5987709.1 type A2 lantipeptide [Leuconostoc gasicomitatum]MBZ5990612.1 type A2 lantipeptide [Leuconostoc gasicomitatum]
MKLNENALSSLEEVTENELDTILGARKSGVINTVSHECNMNSWQFVFTCCA